MTSFSKKPQGRIGTYRPLKKRVKRFEPRQAELKGGQKSTITPEYELACEIRSSQRWKKLRKVAMAKASGMCLFCYKAPADEVHHIKQVSKFPDLAFDLANLLPVCTACHGHIATREKRGEDVLQQITDRMVKHTGVATLEEVV